MKALSIRAPWWLAILEWGKRVENRFWKAPIAYRGPVLIHASAWWRGDEMEEEIAAAAAIARGFPVTPEPPPRSRRYLMDHRGGIVGRARVVDCRWNMGSADPWAIPAHPGLAPPWRTCGAMGIVLDDVETLPFVPLQGSLGLFDVDAERVLRDPRRRLDGPEHGPAVASLLSVLDGGDP